MWERDAVYNTLAEDSQLWHIGVMHDMLPNLLKDMNGFIFWFYECQQLNYAEYSRLELR